MNLEIEKIHVKTKRPRIVKKAFGIDDLGIIDIPIKFSNVKISRMHNVEKVGGCTYCFPHGIECTNATEDKRHNRNWKRYRKTQWK